MLTMIGGLGRTGATPPSMASGRIQVMANNSLATRTAALGLAALVGATSLSTPAQAGDAFAAGLVGGLVGSMIARPYYPVYGAPVVVYAPPRAYAYPQSIYEQPVYAAPPPAYYGGPAYEGPAYAPGRRPLAEIEPGYAEPGYPEPGLAEPGYQQPGYPQPGYPKGPKVLTYDETVTGPSRVAEAWTPEWQAYCTSKFRSFDPRSGTYLGYDGQRHFCVVK